MEDKDKIRILLQVLHHVQRERQALRNALDQHDEEVFLQQWGRPLDRERRERWIQSARN